jgi:predicted RNase H-like HicB family nuclease
MTSVEVRELNLWVLVRPAPDVAGQWVAHCLDLDVVTQGNDFQHALRMLSEAVWMVMVADFELGRDPLKRTRAPEEDWSELYRVQREGTLTNITVVSDRVVAAVQLHVKVGLNVGRERLREASDVEALPPAWMVAALGSIVPGQLALHDPGA